mgnify:CR=1 FL=1|jgi:glycerol-3-phosphate responsive antiterminator
MSYPFGENILPKCDFNPEAFVYEFVHNLGLNPSGKVYTGMHGLKEFESPYDGLYWNSSTDEDFKEMLQTKSKEFTYRIIKFGSMREMFKLENEILLSFDNGLGAKKSKKSWNKSNGILFQTPELPRLYVIDDLVKNAYSKKNPNLKTMKIKDLLSLDLVRLQVRFENNLSSKKILQYKDRMIADNNTDAFTITIIKTLDGKYILVGGNHTLEAAEKANMKNINVVFIYEDLTMEEIYALGDALNRKDKIERMPTEISSVATKIVGLYNAKKITDGTFKDKYSVDYMKITGGLVGREIPACRKEAISMIENKALLPKGTLWKDWKLKKFAKEVVTICIDEINSNTLATSYSGTMFDPDRVVAKWKEDTLIKLANGKEPRKNITVFLHWSTMKSFVEWSKTDEWDKNEETIKAYMYGFLFQNNFFRNWNIDNDLENQKIDINNWFPNVKWKKLEQYEADTN